MPDEVLTIADVMERYGCSRRRATSIMDEAGALRPGAHKVTRLDWLREWEDRQAGREVAAAPESAPRGRRRARARVVGAPVGPDFGLES